MDHLLSKIVPISLAIIISITVMIIMSRIAAHFEAKAFNKGVCKYCGSKLRCFDHDSHGGRGYWCDNCESCNVWVSYNRVDKNFK